MQKWQRLFEAAIVHLQQQFAALERALLMLPIQNRIFSSSLGRSQSCQLFLACFEFGGNFKSELLLARYQCNTRSNVF